LTRLRAASRFVVDARIPPGEWGGVEQVIMGLASGMATLARSSDWLFVCKRGESAWLTPHAPLGSVVEAVETSGRQLGIRQALAGNRIVRAAYESALATRLRPPTSTRASAVVDSLSPAVGVLPYQIAPECRAPYVYFPYDLQHHHFPQLFSTRERARREVIYRTRCERASLVVTMTQWAKRDIVRAFGLPPSRVAVVPGASAIELSSGRGLQPQIDQATWLSLPEKYLIYPAQTWPHKNHMRLLEAIALVRSEGLIVPLICTGRTTEYFASLVRRMRELGIQDQVTFTGFVSSRELHALLTRATALIFPTLFEGWGMPLFDGFAAGVPVACAAVTSLPEHAGDAALLFDPYNVAEMAQAIRRLWCDADLRAQLAARGRVRSADFTWSTSAAILDSLCRYVAGDAVEAEDEARVAQALST